MSAGTSVRARSHHSRGAQEVVIECDEGDAKKVETWLKRAMVDGMDGVLNVPDVDESLVPVEVEVESGGTWGG